MLKGISPLISPQLLKILAEMGHGDTICLADANFPAESHAKAGGGKVVRLEGQPLVPLLEAVLELFPLDENTDKPATLMGKQECDKDLETPIWKEFEACLAKADKRGADMIFTAEKFDFYELAKKCYCIVQTGEKALYANLIIKKGVVK